MGCGHVIIGAAMTRAGTQGRVHAESSLQPARETSPALVYAIFILLLMLATAPAFRIVLLGVSLDDLLQLRCFNPG